MQTNWWALFALAILAGCERGPTGPTTVVPEYHRADWLLWIDADGDCQDTRQEILIDESLIPPTLDRGGCRVVAGLWRDEYTGATYTDPGDLEVDHRVPLANAHRSGAWEWNGTRKRDYANDIVDREHLVAVSASTNRSKGDRGPDSWRPPLREDWCHYAGTWRAVKQRWFLTMTPEEERAIFEMCSS